VGVIHGLPARGDMARPVVLTIGTYDGVHLGHRSLLDRVMEEAQRERGVSVVITFDPHPRCVVDPGRCPPMLTAVDDRLQLLQQSGVERVVLLQFSHELSTWTAERFCDALVDVFPVRRLVTGPGFAVGHRRTGDLDFLRAYGADHGFDVVTVDPLTRGGAMVSSSRIREALVQGRLDEANELLGRRYELGGGVVHGTGTGTGLGFPTVNLDVPPGRCIPATGVYAAWCDVAGQWYPAAASIGFRPTFGGDALTIEAHLLDVSADLYGGRATLSFVQRLREQVRFPSAEALSEQMARDVEQVRSVLAATALPS